MNILYFASMREITGLTNDTIEVSNPTVASIKQLISIKHPRTKELLDSCMIAVDGEY
jgi:molybdopterin converting factor small subunit